jgi:hypothetical protein
MTIHRNFTICAAGALALALVLSAGSQSVAGDRSAAITDFSAQQHKKKVAPKKSVGPRQVAPRQVAPRHIAPRHVAPRRVAPRFGSQQQITPRRVGPKVVAPVKKFTPKTATPGRTLRVVTPSGAAARTVTAGRLRGLAPRGAGRATVRGRNFSAWRGGRYRVRHGGGWRTFVALSALGAIAIGTATYYPYAYIEAPQDYCEGLTEDGCQLMWQEVETLEGDLTDQCVAYCPWQ